MNMMWGGIIFLIIIFVWAYNSTNKEKELDKQIEEEVVEEH